MKRVIAIFDIGKTNKKFFLFDEDYHIVYETSTSGNEIHDEDGFPCDDLVATTQWIKEKLHEKLNDRSFEIVALNFATYGASFVHIDEGGNPLTPLYNYLKPLPDALEKKFYATYGNKEQVALETASPALGMLNSGLQLYWLKHARPDVFALTAVSLHLPQFLACLFHQKRLADITSIGCHTALWNFEKNAYHSWVIAEMIDQKLAPLFDSIEVVHSIVGSKAILCGVGLHDSSAAFIPYIQNIKDPFVLISTGTWCITMNPFNTSSITVKELEQDCLCYMSYKGVRVKASRLFSGYGHEQEAKRMAAHFNTGAEYFAEVKYDPTLVAGLDFTPDAGSVFNCENYTTYEEAYHQLMCRIIQQQKKSTDLVLSSDVKKIFVDGGFAKNEIYMQLLAKAYPDHEVYAASVSQATALGAALAIHRHWNTRPVPENLIAVKKY
ncbi:MAG: carbohydrate kinase [Sphingobacteriales bacterium 41-5]|nr:MAG: carbohydrate kinase [Sphingobacteriales bacterium 41-5]